MLRHESRVIFRLSIQSSESCMSMQLWIPIPSIFTMPYHSQLKEKSEIDEMAPLCRFEPEGSKWIIKEPEAGCFVDKIGWGKFFDNFQWP